MKRRRTLREALAIWDLGPLRLSMAVQYFRVAYRLRATELQAVIISLREVNVAWKLVAYGLDNHRRTCHRRREEMLEALGIDEIELSQILRGKRPVPVLPRRPKTPQERPFRRPDPPADSSAEPPSGRGATFVARHKGASTQGDDSLSSSPA